MNRLRPDADDVRFVRRLVLAILVVAVAAALYRAADLLILAFGAVLGAIAIHAVADLLEDRANVPEKPALGLAIAVLLGLGFAIVWLFAVGFREQVEVLVTRLPGIVDQFAAYLSTSPVGARVVQAVEAAFAGSRIARDIGGLATGAGELALNTLLVLVGSVFFAANPGVYQRGFLLMVPPAKRPAFDDALYDTAATLRLWLRAQLIQMTSMGVLVGLGLWLGGVPSAAMLGLLTGLSEFIPYVGPVAAMLPALGLAATQGTDAIVWTVATFAIVRLVQTNLITPYVTGRVVKIPPAVTLFAILAIGTVFGVFGLFFSAALLVVAYTLIRALYLREVLGEPIPKAEHETLIFDRRSKRITRN
ncbi:AI-2E family transporter [Sphingomonas lenta]|uniref:AI-2E family transporter n=1 Tax=Sphingomonas lenta TaxID=1141887 RepID=A0A2A2SHQ0_9SPHN|nr:AI-2E family transporter [Sphingomonas lenta]PAX08748.1 AI-2E family transporter [Sphingomonas lenta]